MELYQFLPEAIVGGVVNGIKSGIAEDMVVIVAVEAGWM